MNIEKVLIFLGGAIVGGSISFFVSSRIQKKKYRIEIEKFSGVVNSEKEDLTKKEEALNEEKKKFEQVLADFEQKQKERLEAQCATREFSSPKVISVEEASELPYPIKYFCYYTDGTITDNSGDVIANPESFLGNDYESIFKSATNDIYLSSSFFRKVFVIQPMGTEFDGIVEETEYEVDDEEDY